MLQAELKVVGGKQDNQVVSLPHGKFLIGREQDCHLRPNSELVSRHHCVFTADEFGLRVRDLGSTNGTFVNGERIEKQVVLKQGDQVAVGALNFEVQLQEVAVPVGAAEADVIGGGADVPASPEPAADPTMEETEAGSETVFDMQIPPEVTGGDTVQVAASGDTAMLPPQPQPPQPPMPGYPQQQMPYAPPPIQYPPGYGQYQPQPMYPPQYPGYPQPPMPGYPPMPAQQMPPMPQPVAPQPAAAPPAEAPAGEDTPEVTLPSPSETGLKEEADTKGSGGSNKSTDNPSGSAGDIIKQYIQRRPKSS